MESFFSSSPTYIFYLSKPTNQPNPTMSRPIRPVCLERVFQCPSKYIQGPTAIQNAAKYLAPFGKNVMVLSDNIVYKIGTSTVLVLK